MKKLTYICIFTFVVSISSILSYEVHTKRPNLYDNYLQLNRKRLITSCGNNRFLCKDGGCVPSDTVCDGNVDCDDSSDETFTLCRKVRCPGYLFHCSYGACVDKDAKCNGVQDCADNSDELHKDCRKSYAFNTCPHNNYQCDDKSCIPSDQVCDGVSNCKDKSDETIRQCSDFHCPPFAFRCSYGGCVDGEAPCNGIADCADWSDESPDMCKYYNKTQPPNTKDSCKIPSVFNGQLYNNLGFEIKVRAGDRVEPFKQIEFICPSGDKIYTICENGEWTKPFNCPKSCSGIQANEDIKLKCVQRSGRQVNCGQTMTDASVISATCKYGQNQKPYRITCVDGEWSDELPNCDKRKVMIHLEYADDLVITISDVDNVPSYESAKRIILKNNSKVNVVLHDERETEVGNDESFELNERSG